MTRPLPSCAGTATRDYDPFFSDDPADVELAVATCRTCPCRAGCEAGAEARGEEFGVWGGVRRSPDVSMVVAEVARVRVTVASQHGSMGRYASGCRCRPCTAANTAYAKHYRHDGPAVTRDESLDLFEQLTIGASA